MAGETDDDLPCCDYRGHNGQGCACPEHPHSAEHPFGDHPQPTAHDLTEQ